MTIYKIDGEVNGESKMHPVTTNVPEDLVQLLLPVLIEQLIKKDEEDFQKAVKIVNLMLDDEKIIEGIMKITLHRNIFQYIFNNTIYQFSAASPIPQEITEDSIWNNIVKSI